MDRDGDQDLTPGQRFALALTTSALSLTLFGCDPMYMPAPGGPGAPAGPPTVGQPAGPRQFTDQQAYNKYFATGHDYIDAKVLARFWGEPSPAQAKLRLGRKMLNYGPQEGRIHLSEARGAAVQGPPSSWPVWIQDGGYSYADAELLGRYWGRGTYEAKTKLARNLINGNDAWNRAALAAARRV